MRGAWTGPTEREKQCLAAALLHGRREGAIRLGISAATFRNHLNNLNHKLGTDHAREAAIALGWLDIPARYGQTDVPLLEDEHHGGVDQLLNYADALLRELERMPRQ